MSDKCQIFQAFNLPLHGCYYFAYIHMGVLFRDIGVNKKKEICLLNKESISNHRYERKNIAVMCELFMNGCKNLEIYKTY